MLNFVNYGGHSSVGRVPDCGSGCHGFESRCSPGFKNKKTHIIKKQSKVYNNSLEKRKK